MKIVKAINLTFSGTGSLASANVYIPFGVKFMNVKSISYEAVGTATSKGVVITSNMSEDQPMALISQSDTFNSQDVLIEYPVEKIIQGNYTFNLVGAGGALLPSTGDDVVILLCEFYDRNAYPPRFQEHPVKFEVHNTSV